MQRALQHCPHVDLWRAFLIHFVGLTKDHAEIAKAHILKSTLFRNFSIGHKQGTDFREFVQDYAYRKHILYREHILHTDFREYVTRPTKGQLSA